MPDLRLALGHAVRSAGRPAAAAAAREFGVSRKTAHKWLALPDPDYPAGSTLRAVSDSGQVSVDDVRVRVGRGVAGDRVRVEDRGNERAVFYCQKEVRCLPRDQLVRGKVL